jgi:nitrite reductase/ring-hydroxylating ferredoxin subunit
MAFQHASSLDELPPNSMRAVTLSGTPVLLVREGDKVYALEPRCGHMAAHSPKGRWRGMS